MQLAVTTQLSQTPAASTYSANPDAPLCKSKSHLPILDEIRKRLSEITQNLAPHPSDEFLRRRERTLFRREKSEKKVDAFLAS